MDIIPHILVIDDDREIRDLLARFLERNGMRVTAVRDAREARRVWPAANYQLVVLDLMLPGEGGLDLAQWLRQQSGVALVMLTAMGDEADRIIGLELGADDYLAKPFNPRELLARIRAVLRRTTVQAEQRAETGLIRFGGWALEPTRRRLMNPDGVEVALTGGEYDLLAALVDRAGKVLTRDMLLDLLRGRQAGPVRPCHRRGGQPPAPQAGRQRPQRPTDQDRARRRLRAGRGGRTACSDSMIPQHIPSE